MVDVHEQTSAVRDQQGRSPLSLRRRLIGWGLAVLMPAVATAMGAVLDAGAGGHTDLSTDVVLFFLAAVVVALVGGLGPAVLAAVLGGLLLNYFLTAPLYTFVVGEPRNVVAIAAMVLVGVLVALVVDRAARRAAQAARARTEATLLADAARTVLTDADPLPRVLEQVRASFGLRTVVVLEPADPAPRRARSRAERGLATDRQRRPSRMADGRRQRA
jgi:two-component system sensor histidine kinase KdpD